MEGALPGPTRCQRVHTHPHPPVWSLCSFWGRSCPWCRCHIPWPCRELHVGCPLRADARKVSVFLARRRRGTASPGTGTPGCAHPARLPREGAGSPLQRNNAPIAASAPNTAAQRGPAHRPAPAAHRDRNSPAPHPHPVPAAPGDPAGGGHLDTSTCLRCSDPLSGAPRGPAGSVPAGSPGTHRARPGTAVRATLPSHLTVPGLCLGSS